jgi:catechol 2,3-dioxygenase-like lactoylglutathione lyase family enzyme
MSELSERRCHTTIPAADLERARRWYREKLGLEPYQEDDQALWYGCADGSIFWLYPSAFAGTGQQTVIGWLTTDLERDVAALRRRGVRFEEYDVPGLRTVGGIGSFGRYRAAWFKDSEGNTLMVYSIA